MRALDKQLRFAIGNKRLLLINYHGQFRVGEPHDYGIHSGASKLLFYQLRRNADSRWQVAIGWRLLEVSKIDACSVLDKTFPGSRGASHQDHLNWEKLFIRVD
jgi:hypothetical protein